MSFRKVREQLKEYKKKKATKKLARLQVQAYYNPVCSTCSIDYQSVVKTLQKWNLLTILWMSKIYNSIHCSTCNMMLKEYKMLCTLCYWKFSFLQEIGEFREQEKQRWKHFTQKVGVVWVCCLKIPHSHLFIFTPFLPPLSFLPTSLFPAYSHQDNVVVQ